jgi:hypothetical protein
MNFKEIPIRTPADYFSAIDRAIPIFTNGVTRFSQIEAINMVFNMVNEIVSNNYHIEFVSAASPLLDPTLTKNYRDVVEILEWLQYYSTVASYFKETFSQLQIMRDKKDPDLEAFIKDHERLRLLRDNIYSRACTLRKYPFWRVFKEAKKVNEDNLLFRPFSN